MSGAINKNPIAIVGAGISGLVAADVLSRQNQDVYILEKSGALGGRMATRRIETAVFDHGAQYFTAKTLDFLSYVQQWQEKNLIEQWFNKKTASTQYPCYMAPGGMTSIAKAQAVGLNIHKQAKVLRLEVRDQQWVLHLENKEAMHASGVILTSPAPQTLMILKESELILPTNIQPELEAITYEPCVVFLVVLNGPSKLATEEGYQMNENATHISWIADNYRKGISPNGYGLTVQTTPQFSQKHLEEPNELCIEAIQQELKPYLGQANIQEIQVKKWRYSLVKNPKDTYSEMAYASPPLILTGDAFSGPRIENAALSGISAAKKILETLDAIS